MTISQSCGLIKNLQQVCSPVQPVCGPGHPPTCRRRHQAANCGRHCTATDADNSAREVRRESQRCYARRSAQQPPQRPRHPLRQSRRRGGAQGARGGGCATLPAWAVPQTSSEVACRPKRPRCAARPAQRHGRLRCDDHHCSGAVAGASRAIRQPRKRWRESDAFQCVACPWPWMGYQRTDPRAHRRAPSRTGLRKPRRPGSRAAERQTRRARLKAMNKKALQRSTSATPCWRISQGFKSRDEGD